MRAYRTVITIMLAISAVGLPLSSASAGWHHRGLIPGLADAAGAVVVGAATIATAPFAIVAGIAGVPYRYGPPPRFYDRYPRRRYYGPPSRAYVARPQNYYDQLRPRYYRPPPPYYPY
jgi:hypothetical protein